jgi:ubiquinol-cytochrome c reductase core subunit 2
MSFLTRLARAPALKRGYATISDAAGVKVAGIEGAAPPGTMSVTVVVKAGSRFETKPGVAHVLKNFAYKVNTTSIVLMTVDRLRLCVEDC